jgi:small-conductance mechanosensitive channel
VSKIFAHFVPVVFQFFAGVVSPGVRKYYLVLKALEMPLSFVGWALASLLSFAPIMVDNPHTRDRATDDTALKSLQPGFQTIMHELLGAFLVCSLIFLAERFLVQLISISYHRAQFDEKIKENKHAVYLVAQLYDASRVLFPEYCKEFAEEDYIINDSMHLSSLNQIKFGGSANPMKLIQNVGHGVGRIGDKVGAAFGAVAQEVTGKKVFDLDSGHSIVIEALERKKSSEALAKRIWLSFVVEGNDALYQEDLIEVLGQDRQKQAEEAFASIDKDGNGDISLEEMILTITEIGRTRKSLASSMHDVDQAINVLDNLLITIVFILSIFVIVAFVNKSFMTTLATTGTALLSLSFVFATTCQEVLGSCIFLFVKHPFDIGDRVDISGEQLVVEKISLLFTVFKRVNNGKNTQIPNIMLNALWIDNITRSKAMREQLSVFVSFDTTFDDVQLLKKELHKFVIDKENNRDFQPDLDIEVISIAEMNKMELRVEIKHKSNWSNESLRAARRSKFMCALVMALRRVPIYGPGGGSAALGSADSPSFSVSLSPEDAKRNKDTFAVAQQAKRLAPTKPVEPSPRKGSTAGSSTGVSTHGPVAEYRAVQTLNARNAASDPIRDETWLNRDDVSTLNDKPSTSATDAESDRGLLRGDTRGGRRAPNQTLRSSFEQEPLPIRDPSSIPYVPPPRGSSVAGAQFANYNAPQGPQH